MQAVENHQEKKKNQRNCSTVELWFLIFKTRSIFILYANIQEYLFSLKGFFSSFTEKVWSTLKSIFCYIYKFYKGRIVYVVPLTANLPPIHPSCGDTFSCHDERMKRMLLVSRQVEESCTAHSSGWSSTTRNVKKATNGEALQWRRSCFAGL